MTPTADHFELFMAFAGLFITILSSTGTVLLFLRRMDRKFDRFSIEHELLIRDYCERHDIRLDELPTRMKGSLL